MTSNKMQMKGSLAHAVLLTCVLCSPLHTHAGNASVQYDPHPLRAHEFRAVEKRLQEYLTKRVLVFRKGEINRDHVRFDSRGRPTSESGLELRSRPKAILFTGLTLDPERLWFWVRQFECGRGRHSRTFSRSSRTQALTCDHAGCSA